MGRWEMKMGRKQTGDDEEADRRWGQEMGEGDRILGGRRQDMWRKETGDGEGGIGDRWGGDGDVCTGNGFGGDGLRKEETEIGSKGDRDDIRRIFHFRNPPQSDVLDAGHVAKLSREGLQKVGEKL